LDQSGETGHFFTLHLMIFHGTLVWRCTAAGKHIICIQSFRRTYFVECINLIIVSINQKFSVAFPCYLVLSNVQILNTFFLNENALFNRSRFVKKYWTFFYKNPSSVSFFKSSLFLGLLWKTCGTINSLITP